MPWQTSYLEDLDAVLTVYDGVLSPQSLQEAIETTIALGKERGTTRFLGDCSTLEGGHSVVDLYAMAGLIESVGIARNAHEALVLPQLNAAARDVEFWETACRNQGFQVRVFQTVPEARAWLEETTNRERES